MAGAKSLFVLCFLLIIATSQAAPCSQNACYRCCIGYKSKPYCASKCHCSLPSTFFPNELATKEALAVAEMEVDYNHAETALNKMTIEELASKNQELAAKPKCQYNPCYRCCIGYKPKPYCATKCHCSLPSTFFPNELATKEALAVAEMEVDYNRAETALDKMTIEELTSKNEELAAKPKCQYNPCYQCCIGYKPKPYCASKCHCSLPSIFFPNELATKEAVLEEMMMAEGTDAKDVDVEASTSTE